MRIVNNGFILKRDRLPENDLPDNAVGFKAPEMRFDVSVPTFVFIVLCGCAIWLIFAVASFVRGETVINVMNTGALVGLILGLLSVPIQGLLRGLYYSNDAELHVFFSWRFIYIICFEPVSKRQFIIMGLVPSVIIGWCPLILSAFLPMPDVFLNFLFAWGFVSILFSCVYYTSVYCAITQMPPNSMAVMSKDEYYWFIP